MKPNVRVHAAVLSTVVALVAVLLVSAQPGATTMPPVALQLHSLLDRMHADPDATLKQVADWGFQEVEDSVFRKLSPVEFKALLEKHGLTSSIQHYWPQDFDHKMDQIIDECRTLGVKYVMTPVLPQEVPLTRDQIPGIARKFNAWGARLKEAGFKFAYHTHGQEFIADDQGVLFEAIVEQTDPELVGFELDIYWALWGGGDPVDIMKRHGDRVYALHLKDMRKGVAVGNPLGEPPAGDAVVVLGTGQMDLPAILAEAERHQVPHLIIEDESPDAFQQIPLSLKFLQDYYARK